MTDPLAGMTREQAQAEHAVAHVHLEIRFSRDVGVELAGGPLLIGDRRHYSPSCAAMRNAHFFSQFVITMFA